jgi:hypothetical protein
MNVADTIREKVFHLPPKAQEDALREIERIEVRYSRVENHPNKNGDKTLKHPLTLIAELACDVGVTDFAERHDFYAHGKLED